MKTDLIYFDYDEGGWIEIGELRDKLQGKIVESFPEAKFDNSASDDIHPGRFGVEIPDKQLNEYLVWLLKEGEAGRSFTIQLMLFQKEKHEKLRELMKAAGLKVSTEDNDAINQS